MWSSGDLMCEGDTLSMDEIENPPVKFRQKGFPYNQEAITYK